MEKVVVIGLVLLAGCATTEPEPTVLEFPGFHEIDLHMEAGQTLQYKWEAGQRLTFDVHSHFDGEVQVYHSDMSTTLQGTFTPQRSGTYSMMWQGPVTTLTLDYSVA